MEIRRVKGQGTSTVKPTEDDPGNWDVEVRLTEVPDEHWREIWNGLQLDAGETSRIPVVLLPDEQVLRFSAPEEEIAKQIHRIDDLTAQVNERRRELEVELQAERERRRAEEADLARRQAEIQRILDTL